MSAYLDSAGFGTRGWQQLGRRGGSNEITVLLFTTGTVVVEEEVASSFDRPSFGRLLAVFWPSVFRSAFGR